MLSLIKTLSMDIRGEPLWRIVAYWLVIITFFTVPLFVLIAHIISIEVGSFRDLPVGTFSYVWTFHRILAGMLAVMLGLNSLDKRTNGIKKEQNNK